MKPLLPLKLLLLTLVCAASASAQTFTYRDTFANGATYCTTDHQWTRWTTLRSKLDTTGKTFLSMKLSGQYATTGRTCADKWVVRKMAQAMYNGTAYVGTCNGYYWETSLAGSCAATGCGSAGTSEIVHFAVYTAAGSGVCTCAGDPYWVLRHTIRNTNWGGVGTSTTCGAPTQWVELEFKANPPFNLDAGTASITPPSVCVNTQNIAAKFVNYGKKDLDSFNYYVKSNTTTYGPFKAKFKFKTGKDTTFTVYPNFTFTAGTNYALTVWTAKPNNSTDSFPGNDTAKYSFKFLGTPNTPNAFDTTVCGSQALLLRAIPALPGDSLAWYADKAMSKLLGFGKTLKTSFLPSGKKYKFYVTAYSGFSKASFNTGYTFTNYWPGNMFDIKAQSADILIDSFGLNLYSFVHAPGTTPGIEVWLRTGSYTDPGAFSTSSMWTRVYNGTVVAAGSQNRTVLPLSLNLKMGQQYALYMFLSDGMLFNPGSQTKSNGDIEIKTGSANQGNFGNYINNYDWDGEVFYRYLLCKSAPDSSTVDVKKAPDGASLIETVNFQKATKSGGSGVKGLPHVVAFDDTLRYDMNPPTGYTNTGHNTTWKIKSVTMKTSTGRPITNFSWTDPGSAPGRLEYSPATSEIDSFVSATVSFQDLGPNFCDTAITTYIYVAPLPVPKFSRNVKICDGEVVEFTNLSTIESGVMNYKWYFGDGDSSEATEPLHQFPAFGDYVTTLQAISAKYGYIREFKDTITVTQIPKVAFKANNVCEGLTHTFINQTTVSSGTLTYKWTFGVGTASSTAVSPSYKYTTAGKYIVTLNATANGCVATLAKNAYLFAKPKAAFTYPTGSGVKHCTNTSIPFTNQSTISSGVIGQLWDFGDGSNGTVMHPDHNYSAGGSYSVKLYAISEFGCRDTASKTVTVFEAPKVSFTHTQVCDLTPTAFTNNTPTVSGAVANYAWSFGDGNTSTTKSPVHQYSSLGPKTVKLVVTLDNGCQDEFEQKVVVNTQADAKFDVLNACAGTPVQFDNKTTFKQGNITYKWFFGDGQTSVDADPVYTYNPTTTNTYSVLLTAVVDGQCASSATKQLTIYELPKAGFTISDDWTLAKDGYRTVLVTANNLNYPFYRYKFSDGGSLDQHTGKYQFPYEGDFSVTLYVRNDVGCETSSTQAKSIQGSLGTSGTDLSNVKIYPNPSSGILNVSAAQKISSIEVHTLLGVSVKVGMNINDKEASLDFTGLAHGAYLVKVNTEAGSVTQTIVISK